MTAAWPDRRSDVLNALEVLASDPPKLRADDDDPRWPSVTEAVHWLVDDTGWDTEGAADSVGTLLLNGEEVVAVEKVVRAVVTVSERQGPDASDAAWFADPEWPNLCFWAAEAAALFRQ